MINVIITNEYIKIEDKVFPLVKYLQNKVLSFDEKIQIGEDLVHIKFDIDLDNQYYTLYAGVVVDGKDYELLYDDYISLLAGAFLRSRFFDYEAIEERLSDIYGLVQGSNGKIEGLNSVISGSKNEIVGVIDSKFDEVYDRFDDIRDRIGDCNVDLSPVIDKIDEVDDKIKIMDIVTLSEKLDEKLTQIFGLHSLDGSNGSKFKDGSIVKIKGYDGDWKVEGSYPMLNSDGVTIIVYKVVQDGRVLLAPSPFVE